MATLLGMKVNLKKRNEPHPLFCKALENKVVGLNK
jgi:hypothetical protein